jgi:uncharacterized protein with PhoU and TrkA domain
VGEGRRGVGRRRTVPRGAGLPEPDRRDVVAVQREDETTESNPGQETVIRGNDTLIILGRRDACQTVESLASANASIDELEALEAEPDETGDDETPGA